MEMKENNSGFCCFVFHFFAFNFCFMVFILYATHTAFARQSCFLKVFKQSKMNNNTQPYTLIQLKDYYTQVYFQFIIFCAISAILYVLLVVTVSVEFLFQRCFYCCFCCCLKQNEVSFNFLCTFIRRIFLMVLLSSRFLFVYAIFVLLAL